MSYEQARPLFQNIRAAIEGKPVIRKPVIRRGGRESRKPFCPPTWIAKTAIND